MPLSLIWTDEIPKTIEVKAADGSEIPQKAVDLNVTREELLETPPPQFVNRYIYPSLINLRNRLAS